MNKHFTFLSIIVVISFGFFLGFSPTDGRKAPRDPNATYDNPPVVKGPVLDNPSSTLSESFEGGTFPPAGWTKLNPDGGTGWIRQPAGISPIPGWNGGTTTVPTGGGTAAAFCTWNTGGATSNDQWLVTPQITNVQPNDSLSFWLLKPGYTSNSYLDSIDVLISTTTPTAGAFTTVVEKITIPAASSDTVWTKYSYRLGDFVSAGADIYIAWREHVSDNFNDGAAFLLDLVEVTEGSGGLSNFTAYAVDVRNANVVRLNDCDRTIKTPSGGRPIYAGDFDGTGTWYGMQADSLLTIDTATGVITYVGAVTGAASGNNLGMTYDYSTNTMFFIRNISGTTLFSLDLTTRVATLVGSVSTEVMIDVACSNDGNMYGWSLSDSLYSINKVTGAATHIGPLGVNINFAQGGDFDPASNVLVIAGYIGGGVNNLYQVNLSTGAATLICTPPAGEYDAFAISGTVTGITPVSGQTPDRYSLSQNYPNPFNPSTNINFSIPKAAFVTLKVYDMLGREVQTLVSDQLTAGEYITEFNGSTLSSGTYFYRIQAGDFVEIKKMVLLK